MVTGVRSTILANGWCLGACIAGNDGLAAHVSSSNQATICIVVTHDCSVVHESFDEEPFVELLLAHPVLACDGNFMHAKSPRTLHIELATSGPPIPEEIKIRDRQFLDRRLLLDHRADPRFALDPLNRAVLVRWLANRYAARALPDAFNERLGKVRTRLNKLFKTEEAHFIPAIYLALLPGYEELPDTELYRITVAVIYEESKWRELIQQDAEEAFASRFSGILDDCDGIEVAAVTPISERDFTVFQQRRMARWNLDQYSLRSEDVDVNLLPPD